MEPRTFYEVERRSSAAFARDDGEPRKPASTLLHIALVSLALDHLRARRGKRWPRAVIRESRISNPGVGAGWRTGLRNGVKSRLLVFAAQFAPEFIHQVQDSLADVEQLLSRFG